MTPDKFTISESYLDVGDGHQLYIHDWGNKSAKKPIMFLHGGPGLGCHDGNKALFDGAHQRVIFHDQRGSGKSLPLGSLKSNTTPDLIHDIEKIATHFKLNTFIITGGSWGSFLALVYAIKHPQKVAALVLRGTFTGTKAEVDWIDQGHFRLFFPDVWDRYISETPKDHRQNPTAHHFKQILEDTPNKRLSAYAYDNMESSLLYLDDRIELPSLEEYEMDENGIAMEMFYLANSCFVSENYILENAKKLAMPVWLVQGRYDMICPPFGAYDLHKLLPNSSLTWTQAGHSGSDRENQLAVKNILQGLTA